MNEVLDEIKSLLAVSIGDKIKSYYQGEIADGTLPKSKLPALMVIPKRSKLTPKSTGSDSVDFEIEIKVAVNIMNYVDQNGIDGIIEHQVALVDIMEGLNPETNAYKPDSVLGVLRNRSNLLGSGYHFTTDYVVSYSVINTGKFFYHYANLSLRVVGNRKRRIF